MNPVLGSTAFEVCHDWVTISLRHLLSDGNHCWAAIIGIVLVGGIVATAWGWRARSREEREPPRQGSGLGIDVALTLAVAGLSAFHHLWLHDAMNMGWYPYAQDFRDYLTHTLAALDPALLQPCLFRYPMFGWISAAACRMGHLPPYLGTMWASLFSSMLLPPALFLLGRQIAPRPVAIAGAFFFCHFGPVAWNMGTPTDYPFCTLAYVALLAAGMWTLRKGGTGRFLVFGVACAIMLGATAKGLSAVMPALAFGLAGLAWHGRTRPKGIPPALAAFLLPLVAIWTIYHQAGVEAHSLEFQVFNVMDEDARTMLGHGVQPTPSMDWSMSSPWDQRGYWVVGQTRALKRFPSVIRFFLDAPDGRIAFADRKRIFIDTLGFVVDLKPPWLLLLAIPGCLAVLVRPSREPWMPLILAAGLCLTETLGQVWGNLGVRCQFRYIQPIVTTLPLLALVGAAALPRLFAPRGSRCLEIAFWPVIPLLAVILFAEASPFSAARIIRETELEPLDPLYDVWEFQDELWPGDGVVDLTHTLTAHYIFFGTSTPVVVGFRPAVPVGQHIYLGASVASSDWRRRFLVVDACSEAPPHPESQWTCMNRHFDARPERFRRIRPCIVEDLDPGLPIDIDPERDCRP